MALIDKQAAIDVIMGQPPEPHYPSWYAEQINAMQPVQPAQEIINLSVCLEYLRKNGWKVEGQTLSNNHGKWIICTDGYYPYCSRCKKEPKSGEMTDFCPSCGADMRGGKNGTN